MATINKINVGGTEYDLIASSANSVAWDNVSGRPVVFPTPYGVCSTAATNVAKEVTVNGDFILETGARVLVKFANGVSIPAGQQMTLNVTPKDGEATGAKNVYLDDDTLGSSTELNKHFRPGWLGRVYEFVYDGSNWQLLSRHEPDTNTDTTYTNASLGQGYITCSTVADTVAKTATLSGYKLTTGGIVSVKFTNGNTASNPTLNISNKGAKAIYYKGAALTDTSLIKAGDIVTMIYSNYYHIISIDKIPIDKEEYGKYISPSGIVLGTDLTSNTVNTYGGGNSIAAGSSNTIANNISLCYAFGENNNITDTSGEGTTDGATKYTFFAGYGNKLDTSYPQSTGGVAIGLNNTICSAKSTSPGEITEGNTRLYASVALGANNTAGSNVAAGYAIGGGNTATGAASTSIGYSNTSSNTGAVALGYDNTASGTYGVAIGYTNTASGDGSTALGYYNTAAAYQTTVGKYTKAKDGANSTSSNSGYPFLVGNGTGNSTSTRSNAFWVSSGGTCYAEGTFTGSTASDYAECFEWSDGNLNNEDRRGRFVTFDFDDKIRFANINDDYILGIVSALPTVLGDAAADEWHGRYIRDIYGNIIEEEVEIEALVNEETGEVIEPASKGLRRKINPDYDPDKPYIPRLERPEWDAIGMMGKLIVDDDGTCEVGGFAVPGKDGIATRGTSINGYKVIARVDENHIRVIFR